MNFLTLLCILLISDEANAQLWVVPRSERASIVKAKPIITQKDSVKSTQSSVRRIEESISDPILSLLDKVGENPAVWDFTNQYDFKTGSILRGRLLNSVLSTNMESPLLIEVDSDQGLPPGTKLSCLGVTKHSRVSTFCNLMVTSGDSGEEYQINVSILNRDGSAGLKPDVVYKGSEKVITGAIISGTAQGVLDAATFGSTSTLKGGMVNGAMGSMGDVTNLARKEFQTNEPKVAVYAGKEVLIYFNKRFKL